MYSLHELLTPGDITDATRLLRAQGLELPLEVESGVGVRVGERLVACGFLGRGRLMGLCVVPELRGEGVSLMVVDALVKSALEAGERHLFIFTKATEAANFAAAGFESLAATRPGAENPTGAALLEWGTPRLDDWLRTVRTACGHGAPHSSQCQHEHDPRPVGAVVVNANPFTRGHAHLVAQAATFCRTLYVFVVEEDVSTFSFATRIELVRQGVAWLEAGLAHTTQCYVLPGGPYIISRNTFPTYFTGEAGRAGAHAALDAELFASRIASALGITERFVGTEPLSPVTNLYNAALRNALPAHGINVHELPRLEEHGAPISASRVRALLAAGELDAACALTPPATAAYLRAMD